MERNGVPHFAKYRRSRYLRLVHRLRPSHGNITVWKFQAFSVTQILREINFGECKKSKSAIFAILGAP